MRQIDVPIHNPGLEKGSAAVAEDPKVIGPERKNSRFFGPDSENPKREKL